MNKVRALFCVGVLCLVVITACAPPNTPVSNPITDIPANQPDRDGGTQCAKERVPNRFGEPDERWYNEVTGERFDNILDCLTGFNVLFQGEPGRSPYYVE